MLVKNIMDDACVPVSEQASIKELIDLFQKGSRSTLPVVDSQGRLVGVVSLHDLIHHFLPRYMDLIPSLQFLGESKTLEKKMLGQILDPAFALLFLVHDVMVKKPAAVRETDSTFKAMALMMQHNYHHLPVLDREGRFLGMVDQNRIILSFLNQAT
ncbi:MAG: inosine 5'-monophosphate dehydrogenase [candidate division TA06 bacterium ADurb.Bin417]|uniref:Inosine 5'-monophosphate dehydrogenase n=1 Tax=candidate division TA06 bacterium ADurb.Bin417 TaxID=1852828 RepID=A0A1V5MCA1_UNCT6|nr:MAG: inosine 5'-monophosphate dehydrogenase [candidate division TA06 bacterium ADurb.Bin417]